MLPRNMPSVPIGSGERLPMLSLGTGSGQHANVSLATQVWLSSGGRAIDTAYDYRDESSIADGIAASGVQRPEIFLTTKIPCGTYAKASQCIDANLVQLRVARVNLTLIHFDKCFGGSISETWRALEDAKAAGKTGAIGVSNFSPRDLDKLQSSARDWPPAINQCSLSIGYHDDATIAYCKAHSIVYMSYSPLCGGANGSSCQHGSVLNLPEVQAVASAHSVVPAQVALKWIVQQGYPLATAVARKDYVVEDLDLWSWGNLTEAEMAKLSAI
jgi:diketogulonate reductase-like aldo/keto reductase